MDNFYEQLETTSKTKKYLIYRNGMYVFGVFAVAFLFSFSIIPCVIAALITVGAFFMKKKAYVEYEYVFTNGEIDVDAIYEMKKRKRIVSFNVKDIELLAEAESSDVKGFSNKPDRELLAHPQETTKKPYIAMITGGTERLQLIFTPDEGFINMCAKYNPRAVKKYFR